MSYVYGALAGLAWGALAAFLNWRISRAALKKNTGGAMMGANVGRFAVDLVALGAVFLLLSDLAARTVLRPVELSIGVVTSLVGAVAFVIIFHRTRKGRGNAC